MVKNSQNTNQGFCLASYFPDYSGLHKLFPLKLVEKWPDFYKDRNGEGVQKIMIENIFFQ